MRSLELSLSANLHSDRAVFTDPFVADLSNLLLFLKTLHLRSFGTALSIQHLNEMLPHMAHLQSFELNHIQRSSRHAPRPQCFSSTLEELTTSRYSPRSSSDTYDDAGFYLCFPDVHFLSLQWLRIPCGRPDVRSQVQFCSSQHYFYFASSS